MLSKKAAGLIGLGATMAGTVGSQMTSATLLDLFKDNQAKYTQAKYSQHLKDLKRTKESSATKSVIKRMFEVLPAEKRGDVILEIRNFIRAGEFKANELEIIRGKNLSPNAAQNSAKIREVINNLVQEAEEKGVEGKKIIKHLFENIKLPVEVVKNQYAAGNLNPNNPYAKNKIETEIVNKSFKETDLLEKMFHSDNANSDIKLFNSQTDQAISRSYNVSENPNQRENQPNQDVAVINIDENQEYRSFAERCYDKAYENRSLSEEEFGELLLLQGEDDNELLNEGIHHDDVVREGGISNDTKNKLLKYLEKKEKDAVEMFYSETEVGREIVLNELGYKSFKGKLKSAVISLVKTGLKSGVNYAAIALGIAVSGPIGFALGVATGLFTDLALNELENQAEETFNKKQDKRNRQLKEKKDDVKEVVKQTTNYFVGKAGGAVFGTITKKLGIDALADKTGDWLSDKVAFKSNGNAMDDFLGENLQKGAKKAVNSVKEKAVGFFKDKTQKFVKKGLNNFIENQSNDNSNSQEQNNNNENNINNQ